MKRKLLSCLLAAAMLLSLVSVTALADDSGTVTYDLNSDGEDTTLPDGVTQFSTSGDNKSTVDEYYTLTKDAGTDDGTLDYYVTVTWERTAGSATIKGNTYHWDASKQMYEKTTTENELSNNTAATVKITVKNYSNAKVNYEVTYANNDTAGYSTTEAATSGSKTGTLANYITYKDANGSTIANEGIENGTGDAESVTTTGEESYTHTHTAPTATYEGSVTLNANTKTAAAFTNQIVGTYTINITAAPVAKQTVQEIVDSTQNTTLTSIAAPEDDLGGTTAEFPKEIAALTNGSTAALTVEATAAMDAVGAAEFNVVGDNNKALGALDLTLKVTTTTSGVSTTETVSEFKNADGEALAAKITTYVAKGITDFGFSYGGTAFTVVENETDVDAANEVWYNSETGKLVFATTHFSTYVIEGSNNIYDSASNTAYTLSADGTKILGKDDADKTAGLTGTLTLLDCSLSNSVSDALASGKTWEVLHKHCSSAAEGYWHTEDTTAFNGGYGTKVQPYVITNKTQLQNITAKNTGYAYYKVNTGKTGDENIIDCAALEGVDLNGSFDGNGVTFKNLNNDTGIFFQVKTTTDTVCKVGNFTADETCKMTRTYGASLIRQCESNAELYNITTSATITGTVNHASGLVGYTNNLDGNTDCKTLLIRNCTVNSKVYYTSTSCSDGGCAAFVGYAQKGTAVTIQDCTFGGQLYTSDSANVTGGVNYYVSQSQGDINLTVIENGTTLEADAWKTLTNANWIKLFVTNPVAVENQGYTFVKAANATTAEIIFEVRGKTEDIEGWNFVVFDKQQDISSREAGTNIMIADLDYFSSATMTTGAISDSSVSEGVYNIHHPTYDENWLSLPYLYVVQYDAEGNVVGTGSLLLNITLPQDQQPV